ncbi:hypothetical protein Tco_0226326 [Tanacetum coccineum]
MIAGLQSPFVPTQEEESEEQFKDDEFLADLNRTRGLSILGYCLEEPKKKKLTLQQIRALETTNDEKLLERFKRMGMQKKREIGYKNLQKLRYPQMKELYDKVQESIKDSFKEFIPMGSEKEKQMLQERDAKRLLRKRKLHVTARTASKKLKLRTDTIVELRNYLRIVNFEKSAQDRESLEAISFDLQNFMALNSPDGEYLRIYRAYSHFRMLCLSVGDMHILDRQDSSSFYIWLYKTIISIFTQSGVRMILLGDPLSILGDVLATVMMSSGKNQEEILGKLKRYLYKEELMIRMLVHGMEVEAER